MQAADVHETLFRTVSVPPPGIAGACSWTTQEPASSKIIQLCAAPAPETPTATQAVVDAQETLLISPEVP